MLDKHLLKFGFENNKSNYWDCPTCSQGHLKIEDNSLIFKETASTKEYLQYSEEFDIDDIHYVYSCIFQCSNNSCNERISSSGSAKIKFVDIEVDGEYKKEECYYFQPHYFYPPLQIINISNNVPKNVIDKLEKSFELFFCSPSSSANYARSALELILTELKIPKTTISKRNKRVDLKLHNRIEKLPEKYKDLKEHLMAIKCIGNEGSHSGGELTKDNVIELYEILEYALSEIFDGKTQNLKKKVKKINKAKGITKI